MKKLFLLIVFCYSFCTYAQQQKGFSVSSSQYNSSSGKTYALIVGISKYQNPAIPSLQFADRDAVAFRNYLVASGADSNNIILRLNEQAKNGDVWSDINYLTELAGHGDRVFFYFSCHGDVESKTVVQDAFLLPYDAPKVVYASGAIGISLLKSYLETLSAKGVKVIFIADACRSGNLAGGREGIEITANLLSDKWSDEIKILSCQPGEVSLEGKQWGNGRGLFSYEFVNGISGLADKNHDGVVSLGELNQYLTLTVPDAASPVSQYPIVMGKMEEKIATVNSNFFNSVSSLESEQGLASNHIEQEDKSISQLSPAFQRYLLKITGLNRVSDIIQSMIENRFPDDDSLEALIPFIANLRVNPGDDILKQTGYLSKVLFLQACYLSESDNDSMMTIALSKVDTALNLDPNAAYLYWLKGNILDNRSNSLPSTAEQLKAIELSPKFAIPYFEVGENYEETEKYDSAIYYLRLGISLDPKFLDWYCEEMSISFYQLNQIDSAFYYANLWVKTHPHSRRASYHLASLHSLQNDTSEALENLNKSLENGFDHIKFIERDKNLNNIRDLPEFKALMKKYFPDQYKEK